MKKMMLMAILCLATVNMSAQKVYNEILRLSRAGAADKTKDLATRRTYQFKVDELNYMLMKTRELEPNTKMSTIDKQAYAMYDFIDSFIASLASAKTARQRQAVIQAYKEATIHNPRFHDTDTDLVLSYYNRSDYPTPFSLDTDWVKARAAVSKH